MPRLDGVGASLVERPQAPVVSHGGRGPVTPIAFRILLRTRRRPYELMYAARLVYRVGADRPVPSRRTALVSRLMAKRAVILELLVVVGSSRLAISPSDMSPWWV